MTLEDFNKWKDGYADGIRLCGNILRVFRNVKDEDLRKTIKMLEKQWRKYK